MLISATQGWLAERVGFEPTKELPPCRFSRPANKILNKLVFPMFSAAIACGKAGNHKLKRWSAQRQKPAQLFYCARKAGA